MPAPLHPHYDEAGVVYDGGFFYADGVPEPPINPNRKKNRMASLALNLTKLSRQQRVALANVAISKLAPTATPPATPPPPPIAGITTEVTAFTTSTAALQAAMDAYEAGKATQTNLKAAMDAAMDTFMEDFRAVGRVVEAKAKGDPTVLTASGLPLAGTPVPSTVPGQIQNLSVTASDMEGGLDATWDPEVNSTTYEVEVTTSDPLNGPYVRQPSVTGSNTSVPGLTSGQRAWIRVRGTGPKGPGPWSDPANKIVP